jgi:hypothetical protein
MPEGMLLGGSQWQQPSDQGERAWLIRPRLAGAELVTRCGRSSRLSGRHPLGDVPPGRTASKSRTAVEEVTST